MSENAEVIGLKALAWLIGHEELGPVFLGSSGASVENLRETAQDPATLTSVLSFLTMDDAWVREFCDAHDLAYDAPMRALHALPGGAPVHWT
ncbi:MAG: hypothetical protein CSA72_12580 [Rhodobacterales bacterium]|nr:MAG: hypothetical protein CSA72_12580 [Rhodobacterales bacterium]